VGEEGGEAVIAAPSGQSIIGPRGGKGREKKKKTLPLSFKVVIKTQEEGVEARKVALIYPFFIAIPFGRKKKKKRKT